MERRALQRMQATRLRPAIVGFLVPDPGESKREWGEKKKVNKKSLVQGCLSNKVNQYSPTRDQQTLYQFLYYNDKSSLCYPVTMNLRDIIPNEVPLLDLLVVDSKRPDAHQYPPLDELVFFQKNRGLDFTSHKPLGPSNIVPVREIMVGITSDKDIDDIWNWYNSMMDIEQKIYPSGVVSLDVEEIKMRKSDKDLVLAALGTNDPVITGNKLRPGDKWYQWPVKILIGSGLRFMIVVSWPAELIKNETYKIWPHKPQRKLIDFLASLHPAVGVGIKTDIVDLDQHFSEFSPDYPLKMAGWLDLSTLAAMAGWRLQATNMASLSLGVLGGLMDKISSRADGKWCLPWEQLPIEFKIYALGDAKFGHMCFIVLSAILLRDIFPDQDAASFITSHRGSQLPKLFCGWLVKSLTSTELWFDPRALPTDRKELIDCIRDRTQTPTGKFVFSYTPPQRVAVWADLLGNWPTLSNGGPRWLHPVRAHSIEQDKVLRKHHQFSKDIYFASDSLSEPAIKYLTFQQSNIATSFNSTTVVPEGKLGLLAPPWLEKDLLLIDPLSMKVGELIKSAKLQGRSQRFCIYEFARLNPLVIKDIIKRFDKAGDITKEFWLQHESLYEDLRLMHFNLFAKPIEPIQWIEDRIKKTNENLLKSEMDALAEAKRVYEIRAYRVATLKHLQDQGTELRRTGLVNSIPPLYRANLKTKNTQQQRPKTTNVPFPQMLPFSKIQQHAQPHVSNIKLHQKLVDNVTKGRLLVDKAGEKILYLDEEHEIYVSKKGVSQTSRPHLSLGDPVGKRKFHEDSPSTSKAFKASPNISAMDDASPDRVVTIDSSPERIINLIPGGAENDPDIDPNCDDLNDHPSAHPDWVYFHD